MTVDIEEVGTDIHRTLDEKSEAALRSIVAYTSTDYSICHMRDDVETEYSTSEIERAIEQLRFQSLEEAYLNDVFADVHGEFECHIAVFANAVEFNFVITDGTGIEVAFDAEALATDDDLVTDIRDLIVAHSAIE